MSSASISFSLSLSLPVGVLPDGLSEQVPTYNVLMTVQITGAPGSK